MVLSINAADQIISLRLTAAAGDKHCRDDKGDVYRHDRASKMTCSQKIGLVSNEKDFSKGTTQCDLLPSGGSFLLTNSGFY